MAKIKAKYGIDAPGVIRNLIIIGVVLYVLGIFVLPRINAGSWLTTLNWTMLYTGIFMIIEALLMIWYSKYGKLRHRDRMLALYSFTGHEKVLDVGAGRGLLAIGAAKHLTDGQVTALDIWRTQDLSDNTKGALLANARSEGVEERIDVLSDDICTTNLADDSFDVILSNLCLHNIPKAELRAQACHQILRILKPGGTAVISDFKHTATYSKVFHEAGAGVSKVGTYLFSTFPALTVIKITKPI
ncbi:Methyltransferase domain-containing protein [Arachidicoccus rhizosphaerae]|jgi:SAM-dependent methyltransferase|uniref:Methyltransferase domain-containing protein n=1 Tax=Arachidicoccus rhizosphaerae TaxID=551991 RepID=A0A1H3WAC9_9BACT|nr:class I SAM-dependent methyltransferase [Arachidicoccus rhizosphaerae]SDZ83940.1 Methyltransferase domain-containing protein [Arachidicoccus rhizosphaerae]